MPDSSLKELVALASKYPVNDWDFVDWTYGSTDLSMQATSHNLSQFLDTLRREIFTHKFVVIGLSTLIDTFPPSIAAAAATLLLCTFGTPLRVFLSHPYWRKLGVDLSRPPESSGGSGNSPFHMDFVNAQNPPDLVCLLCLRPDPLGGGRSLLASIDGIEQLLDPVHVDILSRPQFSDGMVYNLNGVGEDINPFPVITSGSLWRYRFTANLLHSTPNSQGLTALQAVTNILNSRAVSLTLARGDLLILDQHKMTHGRSAMGEGQGTIPEDKRRFLLHSFVRKEQSLLSFNGNGQTDERQDAPPYR